MRPDDRHRRLPLAFALLTLVGVAGGCASHRPAEMYPAYYERWGDVSPDLRRELDAARAGVVGTHDDPGPILRFARCASELAVREGRNWLSLADQRSRLGDRVDDVKVSRARQRVVEAATHALTLFREFQYRGGRLDPRDELQTVWLLLLRGDDREAFVVVDELVRRSDLPPEVRARLERLEWSEEVQSQTEPTRSPTDETGAP